MFATAFAFLRLRRKDVLAAGGLSTDCWVPLYAAEDGMGGVRVLTGEVLVRWGWRLHFSCDGAAPLTVCTALPPPPAVQPADEVAAPTSVKGGAEVPSPPPPPPSYLWLQVCDFVALGGSLRDTAAGTEGGELFVVVCIDETPSVSEMPPRDEDDHQPQEPRRLGCSAAKYGDCTAGAVFDAASKRWVWMEYCLLPLLPDEELSFCFEVRRSGRDGDTHLVGSGSLTRRDSIGRWKAAVAIFAAGAAQPCGALTVALLQAPLSGASTVVSTSQPRELAARPLAGGEASQPEPETGGEVEGVECPPAFSVFEAAELALLRVTVHTAEIYGRSVAPSDGGWELTLRSDVACAAGDTCKWTRLEATPPLRGAGGEEWVGAVCARSGSALEFSLLRRVVAGGRGAPPTGPREVCGRFVARFALPLAGDPERRLHVDLVRSASSGPFKDIPVPVGRLCASCCPLMHSGALYDPRPVFFRRTLYLAVAELLGVVRVRRQSANNTAETSDSETAEEEDGARNEEAYLCMRLQCGAAAAVSSLFAPPTVAVSSRRGAQLDGEHDCRVPHFSLRLDCGPEDAAEAAAVRLSLHLCPAPTLPQRQGAGNDVPAGVLIGEALAQVPTPRTSEDANWPSAVAAVDWVNLAVDAASLWVPIPAVGVRSARTAYARLQYAWSYEVGLGSWLACIRIRSPGRQPTLHRPFLCFVMRFPNGVRLRLPLDLFGTLLSSPQPPRADHLEGVALPLRSAWSFSHIQLPVVWPLGAQVEAVELHDRVAAGFSMHLGTHPWTSGDTPLLSLLLLDDIAGSAQPSSRSPFSASARWLRFADVGGGAQGGRRHECGGARGPAGALRLSARRRRRGGAGPARALPLVAPAGLLASHRPWPRRGGAGGGPVGGELPPAPRPLAPGVGSSSSSGSGSGRRRGMGVGGRWGRGRGGVQGG
ncbi:uncharacterized protein Tco025E_04546 [Trypanosoma conorhini]|uniref:Uncharacterized protein n=1 Tax=Trypanosoma conorhini TaxID=83891 RepID=A0A3R7L2G3_9TRYP|nr:uncharacterized protein Tco025E_04546 [Trypanosoma conorhini]RNF18329.1 hypothetical protein Tco025E_04546 [Trypanosoma conorhini]